MRTLRLVILLGVALSSSACFHFSTLLTVRADGSGTIQQHLVFTPAAVAQLRQLSALSGSQQSGEVISEQQARDAAPSFGAGVSYVSSTVINGPEGQGRDVTYAFKDVTQIHLAQAPAAPGGVSVNMPNLGTDAQVAFTMAHRPDGVSVLTVRVPQTAGATAGRASQMPIGGSMSPDQLALMRPMFAGAKLSIAIEPEGQLIRTSSPYVDGRRVTLVALDMDALFADPTLLTRLQAAKTTDEAKAIVKGVPGVQVNLDPETTIEFK